MAPPAAANPSSTNPAVHTTPSNPPATLATKNLLHESLISCFAPFPTPQAPAKFNPIIVMTHLFRTMLKDKPLLVLWTPSNDNQIVLMLALVPKGEATFNFKVSTMQINHKNQIQVCIGCHVLSNQSLSNIKFCSPEGNLLAWLKKEHIFLESDDLGIDCPVTIGYFTKIAATFMHLANFHEHLANQLMLVDIGTELAVDLALHLKQAQLDAMLSGDGYIQSFLPSKYTTPASAMVVNRPKSQPRSLVLKVHQKMPNYLENSLCDWCLLPIMTTTTVFLSQKEWPTYLACKPMSKSWEIITFSWPQWQQYQWIWNMMPGLQSLTWIRHPKTNQFLFMTIFYANLGSSRMNWLQKTSASSSPQNPIYQKFKPGLMQIWSHWSGNWYHRVLTCPFPPPTMTWQTCAFSNESDLCQHPKKAILPCLNANHTRCSQKLTPRQMACSNPWIWARPFVGFDCAHCYLHCNQ